MTNGVSLKDSAMLLANEHQRGIQIILRQGLFLESSPRYGSTLWTTLAMKAGNEHRLRHLPGLKTYQGAVKKSAPSVHPPAHFISWLRQESEANITFHKSASHIWMLTYQQTVICCAAAVIGWACAKKCEPSTAQDHAYGFSWALLQHLCTPTFLIWLCARSSRSSAVSSESPSKRWMLLKVRTRTCTGV
eukprot:scaffold133361_cov17-Tisochrysis_lutea.AAC.1